jgi:uncharacterized membrane protein YcaP (DUF421 family)
MLEDLIGTGTDLSPLQMGIRAFFIFLIAGGLIRLAGIRAFGMKSPFDYTIILLLGAILSRAVYGGSSFFSIITACLVIVLMHRLFGFLSLYSDTFGKLIKGDKILLFKDGATIRKNMRKSLISNKDLAEGIRMEIHAEGQDHVDAAYLERSGHISVILKE